MGHANKGLRYCAAFEIPYARASDAKIVDIFHVADDIRARGLLCGVGPLCSTRFAILAHAWTDWRF